MKKIIIGAIIGWASIQSISAMAEDLQFMLINKSSSNVVGLEISKSSTQKWEDDILGGTLEPRSEVEISIEDGEGTCSYDMRVSFDDAEPLEEYNYNLCEAESYTVSD
ncbi:MAG: hypothetical protein R8K20_00315 [Gallionellaceae bacterium]